MRFPSEKELARLREKYPPGTKVILDEMDDPQAPPVGTIGEVIAVDDAGQLVMNWESGGSLSLIPGVDKFRKVSEKP